jgi:hypothetical protein
MFWIVVIFDVSHDLDFLFVLVLPLHTKELKETKYLFPHFVFFGSIVQKSKFFEEV